MNDLPNFLDIATLLIELGYSVVPLEGKSPHILGGDWPNQATRASDQIRRWAERWPHANVGVVRDDEKFHILDIDDWQWFAEATEHLPPLYAGLDEPIASVVVTGNFGLHIYVAGPKPAWARALPNPKHTSKEETPNEKPSLIEFPKMVVGPGSIHPVTHRIYEALANFGKPKTLPKEYLAWLQSLYSKDLSPHALKCRPLKPGTSLQSVLDSTELKSKYTVEEKSDRLWFFYHTQLGRCLVKGAAHQQQLRNNSQCGFYQMKADPSDFGHFCLDSDCQCAPGGQRKAALSALGLSLTDLLRHKARDKFRSKNELNQKPLEFAVENFIPEEGITLFGAISGHTKTLNMISLAKAISTGALAYGFLKTKRYPILYMLAESGDSALNKRLEAFRVADSEDFLVRTMSQGMTLALNDPDLVEIAKGRVVFLDTLVRWLKGRNENDAAAMAELLQLALDLLTAGAVAVVIAQHARKETKKAPFEMTPDCVIRGSGDILAIAAAAHGIYQLDHRARDQTLAHIECVKARDFEPLRPFQLQGKPYINRDGDFVCVKKPAQCGWFDQEKKEFDATDKDADKRPNVSRIKALQQISSDGKKRTQKEIAEQLGVCVRTLQRTLKLNGIAQEHDDEEELSVADIADNVAI